MTGGLFGSGILDVVLGLVFIYFVYSVVCSAINEILAGLFKWRARDLELAIYNMLCDSNLAQQVLDHPLIRGMGNTDQENWIVQALAGPNRSGRPDYIPSRTFSLALFETLVPADTLGPVTVSKLREKAKEYVEEGRSKGSAAISEADKRLTEGRAAAGKALLTLIDASQKPGSTLITLEDIKKVVTDGVDPDKTNAARRQAVNDLTSLAQLRSFVEGNTVPIPEETRKQAARLIDDIQKEIDEVRGSVELWFDNAMDRLKGVYKRRVQMWLLLIAAVITLLSGADTFQIIRGLQRDPTIRNVLVQEAGRIVATPQPGATTPAQPATISDPATLATQLDQIQPLIGYVNMPKDAGGILLKILGLLVTMGAISMGAPFWFQVLQKAANVRNAGPQPASTTQPAANGGGKT